MKAILGALQDFGPLMCREIAELIGMHRDDVSMVLARLMRRGERKGKRIHISDWTRVFEGIRDYPRPVYSFGDGVDVKKPKPKPREAINKDRRARNRSRETTNFVFNLRAPYQKRAVDRVSA